MTTGTISRSSPSVTLASAAAAQPRANASSHSFDSATYVSPARTGAASASCTAASARALSEARGAQACDDAADDAMAG